MKKIGISMVALLIGLPTMARADLSTVTLKTAQETTANTNVASTSYVRGAYNDLAGYINANAGAINTLNGSDSTAGSVAKAVKDNAAAADYDNTGSGLQATTIQGAIDEVATAAAGALTAGDITTGTTDGSIKVGNTDVSVAGLGSAAFVDTGDLAGTAGTYDNTDSGLQATTIQGAIDEVATTAAGALTASDITAGSANGTISVDGTDVSVTGLGSAAFVNTGDLADTAGTYDNTDSGLTATTIQDAIDEVATAAGTAKGFDVYTTWDNDNVKQFKTVIAQPQQQQP